MNCGLGGAERGVVYELRIADCGLRIYFGMRNAECGFDCGFDCGLESAIRTPHSAIDPHSALRNPQ
jgi:hypothetical protein